ncbi:MAG: hypothetical protein ABIH68_00300 [bacterium]
MKRKSRDCKKTEKLFEKYFSDELQGSIKAEIEGHISSCDDCRNRALAYNTVERTVESAHLLPQDRYAEKEIPSHLKAKLFANIEAINSQTPPFSLKIFLRPAYIAIATAVILIIPLRIIKKPNKGITKYYDSNNFIADAIAQARSINDTERITAKTSDIIGIAK